MTPFRWKIMGGFLALSVGGLAACADPKSDHLQKPTPRPNVSPDTTQRPADNPADVLKVPPPPDARDTLPPVPPQAQTPPVSEFTLQLPPSNPPTPRPVPVPSTPYVPDGGTVILSGQQSVAGPEVLPRPRVLHGEPVAVASGPTAPPAPMPAPIEPMAPQSPPLPLPPVNATPPLASPMVPQVPMNPAPTVPAPSPQLPIAPPAPMAPPMDAAPPVPPLTPPVQSVAARTGDKLKMLVRLGSGTPRFEIRNPTGENLLLKVYGQKIEMKQSPEQGSSSQLAGVSAIGKVKFTGPGVEGSCDQLSILSGTGEVLLQGNIHLKTKSGKTWSEISADKVIYQIGATGLLTPSPSRSGVTPASYPPQ